MKRGHGEAELRLREATNLLAHFKINLKNLYKFFLLQIIAFDSEFISESNAVKNEPLRFKKNFCLFLPFFAFFAKRPFPPIRRVKNLTYVLWENFEKKSATRAIKIFEFRFQF